MLVRPFKPKQPLAYQRYLVGRPSALRFGIVSQSRRPLTTDAVDVASLAPSEAPKRANGVFFISNVLPIRLGRFDFRSIFSSLREDHLLEDLETIADDVNEHGWRLENLEISRKDGGVFLNYSYLPPSEPDLPFSAPRTFLPLLSTAAHARGGFPNWLGKWYASTFLPGPPQLASSAIEEIEKEGVGGVAQDAQHSAALVEAEETAARLRKRGNQEVVHEKGRKIFGLGDGRCWAVRGKQWTEDLDRYSSSRLRVEFDGPDVSQEVLYELFRPYGRVSNIVPPSPVPAGSLRFAQIVYTRLTPSTIAINVLHGLSTPTNTRDFTLVKDAHTGNGGGTAPPAIPRTRLRLFYERPLKAHAFRDWLASHPRLTIPAVAFLIGTLSYTFFDPIRSFFVQAHVQGYFELEGYSFVKWVRAKFVLPSGFSFGSSSPDNSASSDGVGRGAWQDRIAAEKQVLSWISESPGTFIAVTGPPGSGKASLVNRVIQDKEKKALFIDCSKIAKAKTDAAVISELAQQTGYWPVFSFMNNVSGLIDLAAVGLIGQKAGFATPLDQQIKQVLEVVATALKETSESRREALKDDLRHQDEVEQRRESKVQRTQRIEKGLWHDGRLDCIAGNGIMSELGFGEEEMTDKDSAVPVLNTMEEPTPTTSLVDSAAIRSALVQKQASEVDAERDYTESLPILVLDNFTQKTNTKPEIWNVLAEWAAGLVENKIAHVIVVCDSSSASKALTKALPTKPLNTISLADADRENSMAYVVSKLGSTGASLSPEETEQIEKIGGRMIDLELLVYKVRTGLTVKEAVDDIITRSVIELRKAAFGDDADDAKNLSWTRPQAWKVVNDLAKKQEIPYAALLQDFPFKGNEGALRALEDHDMIAVSYVDGRPSMIRPGKPLYRHVFQRLAEDTVFSASTTIEYNASLISTAETLIKSIEDELLRLKEIGPRDSPTIAARMIPFGSTTSAMEMREEYLLEKMNKAVKALGALEKENASCKANLAGGR